MPVEILGEALSYERCARRIAVRESLHQVGFDEPKKALGLAAIEPDDGGDVLFLLRAEVAHRARHLAEDIARIERSRRPSSFSLARSKNQSWHGTVRV